MVEVRGVTRYGRFAANSRNAAGDWSGFTRHRSSLNDKTGERAGSATVALNHERVVDSRAYGAMSRLWSDHVIAAVRGRERKGLTVRTKAISVIHRAPP
jgi:hypothetical protein